MDLSIYDIIKGPVVTEKAYKLNNQPVKKLVLRVHMQSNKPLIADAIEKLFNVKVDNVRIMIRKGKIKRSRTGRRTQGQAQKKAIVTLSEGYSLNLFDEAGTHAAAPEQQATSTQASNK